MKKLAACVMVTCSFLAVPPQQSAGLPRPSRPPLIDSQKSEGGKDSIRAGSRTLALGGKLIDYRFPREGNLVALTDKTVEWHMFGPEPDDYHLASQVKNTEGAALACSGFAKSGNWVGVGRKDAKLAVYRFSAGVEGPQRIEAKSGFALLRKCELRELGKGERAGKGELEVSIKTEYDAKPIRIAVRKTE